MFLARIALTATLVTVPSLVSTSARADDRAAAVQLFQEGKTLMAAGNFAEACPKFASAANLSPTAGVRLNLGDCYDKLGRTAASSTVYGEALAIAERAGDKPAAELARSRLAALKPRLSFLAVKVPPEAAIAGLEIARDGEKLPQDAWGTSLVVDPGKHEVTATAPGHARWVTTVNVTGPGEQGVTVPLLEPDRAAGTAGGSATSNPDGLGSAIGATDATPRGPGLFAGPGGTQRTAAVIGAGLGVVGLAVGSYFGAAMLSRKNDYQQHENANGQCSDLECQTASHDAANAGNVATVGFVAGGALLVAGAALWFTAPREAQSPPPVALLPFAGPGSVGLGAAGKW
jgi:serine/threonine-protein kinase